MEEDVGMGEEEVWYICVWFCEERDGGGGRCVDVNGKDGDV